jgi:hypothetical protein
MCQGRERNEIPMPDVELWNGVGNIFWLVTMLTFAVISIYQVLCVTWILCEHWSGRGTDMGCH